MPLLWLFCLALLFPHFRRKGNLHDGILPNFMGKTDDGMGVAEHPVVHGGPRAHWDRPARWRNEVDTISIIAWSAAQTRINVWWRQKLFNGHRLTKSNYRFVPSSQHVSGRNKARGVIWEELVVIVRSFFQWLVAESVGSLGLIDMTCLFIDCPQLHRELILPGRQLQYDCSSGQLRSHPHCRSEGKLTSPSCNFLATSTTEEMQMRRWEMK